METLIVKGEVASNSFGTWFCKQSEKKRRHEYGITEVLILLKFDTRELQLKEYYEIDCNYESKMCKITTKLTTCTLKVTSKTPL